MVPRPRSLILDLHFRRSRRRSKVPSWLNHTMLPFQNPSKSSGQRSPARLQIERQGFTGGNRGDLRDATFLAVAVTEREECLSGSRQRVTWIGRRMRWWKDFPCK